MCLPFAKFLCTNNNQRYFPEFSLLLLLFLSDVFRDFFFFFARRWSDKSDEIAAYKFDFAVVRFKDFFLIVVRERKEHARDDI